MRRFATLTLVLLAVVLAGGCTEEERAPLTPDGASGGPPPYSPEAMAFELVQEASWIEEGEARLDGAPIVSVMDHQNLITEFEREVIAGNIAHYSAVIETGPGPYDRIGIHRVVRETRPFRPIWSPKALFLLHGDLKNFEGMWIPGQYSPNLPDDFGLAVYLARQGIDVWGMDQSWNFIPQEETDFSFLQGWGMQKEVDHLSIGLAVARNARAFSGHKLEKMLFLGYSSGCMTGYSFLNEEAQRPEAMRQAKGFIAADCGVRSDDQTWIDANLPYVDWYQSLYDSGQYQEILTTRDVAYRARYLPGDESPYAPGLTNLQFALFLGGGQIWAPAFTHYHAPIVEDGLPIGFQFLSIDQWLDFLENTAAYEPILFLLEYNILFCNLDSPFVSNLSDITVPVLDIGGAGGIAPYMAATVGYLGSTDITQMYVSVGAPEPALDYGHIDIFTASNSPELVWEPIARWVIQHSNEGQGGHGGHGEGSQSAQEIAVGD